MPSRRLLQHLGSKRGSGVSAPGYRLGRCPVTGKAQYTTRRIAKKANKMFNDTARPFRCEHCSFFHNGHLYGLTRADHRAYHSAAREGA